MWFQSSTRLGLSAQSIADGSGRDYPHDPSDLGRCIAYCAGRFSTADLRKRMSGRSIEWDRLLPEWDRLAELLQHEIDTRTDHTAPRTYAEMKRVLNDGVSCTDCDGTGRGEPCLKCKGTGRRSGGKCRADQCFRGSDFCPTCHGRGYATNKKAA